MKAYHFTSRNQLAGIDRDGLTKGMVPWRIEQDRTVSKMHRLQWMTSDGNFESQSWEAMVAWPANMITWKTECRLTIDIPQLALYRCVRWLDFAKTHNLKFAHYAATFSGHARWLIYIGHVPREWITAIDFNPEKRNLQQLETHGQE